MHVPHTLKCITQHGAITVTLIVICERECSMQQYIDATLWNRPRFKKIPTFVMLRMSTCNDLNRQSKGAINIIQGKQFTQTKL